MPTPSGTTTYVYGSKLILTKDATKRTFYFQDQISSNRVTTNAQAVLQSKFSSYPFGKTLAKESTSGGTQKYTYTGKEDDGKLMYYGARYLDSRTGRFTSVDPALSSFAAYDYAAGNPIKYRDPTGKRIYGGSSTINDFSWMPMYATDATGFRGLVEGLAVQGLNMASTALDVFLIPEACMAAAGMDAEDRQIANVMVGLATMGLSAAPGAADYAAARIASIGNRASATEMLPTAILPSGKVIPPSTTAAPTARVVGSAEFNLLESTGAVPQRAALGTTGEEVGQQIDDMIRAGYNEFYNQGQTRATPFYPVAQEPNLVPGQLPGFEADFIRSSSSYPDVYRLTFREGARGYNLKGAGFKKPDIVGEFHRVDGYTSSDVMSRERFVGFQGGDSDIPIWEPVQ
jgi:RHS repeat-associated protein